MLLKMVKYRIFWANPPKVRGECYQDHFGGLVRIFDRSSMILSLREMQTLYLIMFSPKGLLPKPHTTCILTQVRLYVFVTVSHKGQLHDLIIVGQSLLWLHFHKLKKMNFVWKESKEIIFNHIYCGWVFQTMVKLISHGISIYLYMRT